MKKFKVIAVLAAAVMALSAAAVLSGCGGDSSSKATSSSSAVETTAAATKAEPAEADDATEAQNDDQQATGEEQTEGAEDDVDYTIDENIPDDEKHGNITSDEAAQISLQNLEYGQVVTLVDPAEFGGKDCWHVVVMDTAGKYINCYVSSTMFETIKQNDPDDPYADVDGYYDFGGAGADRAEP